jgi:HEAT repeats
MASSRTWRRLGVAVVAVVALLAVRPRAAHADNVGALVEQLVNGSDYKVRLSAALSLAKIGDARAVPGFIAALKDSDKTVRGAAAVGLSKVVNGTTRAALRRSAMEALERARKADSSSFVRRQAEKALATLRELQTGSAAAAGAIYVNIGQMSAKTESAKKMRDLMRQTTIKTFAKAAKDMSTNWPGGIPNKRQLAARHAAGYHVDGTLTDLTVTARGSARIVGCKVSMYIATFPDKSVFGFLNGGANVQASSDPRDVEGAKGDCVTAVVEDLVARKIVPTIQTRSGK